MLVCENRIRWCAWILFAIIALPLAGCRTYRSDGAIILNGEKIPLGTMYACSWGGPDDESNFEVRYKPPSDAGKTLDAVYTIIDDGMFDLSNNRLRFKQLSVDFFLAQLEYKNHKPRYYFIRLNAEGKLTIGGPNEVKEGEIRNVAKSHSIKLEVANAFIGQDVRAVGETQNIEDFFEAHTFDLIYFKYTCNPKS